MFSYFVLLILNFLALYFIGLWPAKELLRADYELGGIFLMILSGVLWMPSTILVLLVYKALEKMFSLKLLNRVVMIVLTATIQFVSVFSVFPGLSLLYKYKEFSEKSKFELATKPSYEIIDLVNGSFVYKYQIPIENTANSVQSVKFRVLPMVEDPEAYTKYCSLVSPEYNNFKNQSLYPGKSILSGELVLFNPTLCEKYNPLNSAIKLQVGIESNNIQNYKYIDTGYSDWKTKYLDYRSSK